MTDINPQRIVARTNAELTQGQMDLGLMSLDGLSDFIGVPNDSASSWVEINISDLHVRQAMRMNTFNNNAISSVPNVFFVPNRANLPTSGILINSAQMYEPQAQEADLLGLW